MRTLDRRAIIFLLAILNGCGFFQDFDGYVGTPKNLEAGDASAPPLATAPRPPPYADQTSVHLTVDAAAPPAWLVVSGGDDGTNGVASVEIAEIPQDVLAAWTSAPLPYAPGVGAASAPFAGGVLVAGGAGSDAVHIGARGGASVAWTSAPSLGAPAFSHALAVGDHFAITTGGADPNSLPAASVLVAHRDAPGALGPWTASQTLPEGVAHHASVAVGDRVLVLGGMPGLGVFRLPNPSDVVFIASYDPAAGLGAFSRATSLSSPRADLCAVALGARVYVVGGRIEAGPVATVESIAVDPATGTLDPAWNTLTPLPTPRARVACAVSSARLYVAGGTDASGVVDRVDSAEILAGGDLGAWRSEPHLTTPRAGAAAAVLSP